MFQEQESELFLKYSWSFLVKSGLILNYFSFFINNLRAFGKHSINVLNTSNFMSFIFPNILSLSSLIFGEGFGFNGNILETNILNLSVVIGIVVSLGGDALRELLDNRKSAILSTISSSEERAKKALETLENAKKELSIAQKKAIEIRENAKQVIVDVTTQSSEQRRSDIGRLEDTKNSRTASALLTAKGDLSSYTVKLALEKAKTKLKTLLDSAFHEKVNNSQLTILNEWSF